MYLNLTTGDPAPWFNQRAVGNPNYNFSAAAGRYIVLCFFASAADAQSRAAIDAALRHRHFFDDARGSFFGVSVDPRDEAEKRLANSLPGYRFFWDFDRRVSKLYGAVSNDAGTEASRVAVRRIWVVLDPTLRVLKVVEFRPNGTEVPELLAYLDRLPPPARFAGFELQAPVLFLPNVFEPEMCAKLVAMYEAHGGEESGVMQEVEGKTVGVYDHSFKNRKDYLIEDRDVIKATQARVKRRIIPEIAKVHQFEATRMERYIVSCYSADDKAHFSAHRDNTTKGTAHRKFAVSISLNEDFDGGELNFPEYGPRTFKAPLGGAVVFSCSLLHAVTRVTRGRRYVFLPFLYDDAAARLREANARFLEAEKAGYKSGIE